MKEVEQPVLVLFNGHPKLVDIAAKIIDPWTPRHVPQVFEVLQSTANLGSVALRLGSDVVKSKLSPGA